VSTFKDGQCVFKDIPPGSPGEKAGIKIGDILVSVNSFTLYEWTSIQRVKAGDTARYTILRDGQEQTLPLIYDRRNAGFSWFFIMMSAIMCLFSIASLYLIYKKPHDLAVRLFFIYMLCFAVCQNAIGLPFPELLPIFTFVAFNFAACMLGPVLVHFHLFFPRPSKMITRFSRLPAVLYVPGFLLFILYSVLSILRTYIGNDFESTYWLLNRMVLIWITFTYILALVTAFYQFHEIKDTLARNQLRIVIIGSFFALSTPIGFTFFHDSLYRLQEYFPFIMEFFSGAGTLIMVVCCLIAIFRYRIWDTEILIRKTLLYLCATFVILFSYLLLIYLVNLLTISENDLTRFLILAISVIVFLVLRDRIQHLIDRFFHRESYDSATVVSDFEEKLAGIYHFDELKSKITQSLDEIFHFKSFVFNMKTKETFYEPVSLLGIDDQSINAEFEGTNELERKLSTSKIFSPDELNIKPSIFEMIRGELVVPLLSGIHPNGFFICGPKRSERVYSLQDIRVLSLLAKRVNALFHTANLYQKDLDRQLTLERERARISQDMHDDIGAGLTKIAMISEAPGRMLDDKITSDVRKRGEVGGKELKDRLDRIASSSREMISRLNVIVWALNPKYDTLDSLVAYSRRYFGEYLDNSGIRFKMELTDAIPKLAITPDFRRNVFYAIQEAIHNAVKHGDCSEIDLTIQPHPPTPSPQGEGESGERCIIPTHLTIIISDNGKGFDKNKNGLHGNGLLNMKKRAEDLSGWFEIQSSPGKGTRVFFIITMSENTTKG